MPPKETPAELFKRSLAQTTRALAGAEEEMSIETRPPITSARAGGIPL